MATTEQIRPQPHDRPVRRRPFSNWMKKLANFKGSSSADANNALGSKRNGYAAKSHSKKHNQPNNNPYMTAGNWNASLPSPSNGHLSFSTTPTGRTTSTASLDRSRRSFRSSVDGIPPTTRAASNAPTVSTDAGFGQSDAARSHGASSGKGTTATVGDGPSTGRGPDSTFSSPAPSLRSLTTTLTTVHSTAAPAAGPAQSSSNAGGPGGNGNYSQPIHFTHQFPTSPPPATALPAHLAPQGSGGHPATYNTATANNLLTDNASILTLASSSKRRRRRSFDTDASVRALAPSSLFGGSRESLPLSILSANIDFGSSIPTPGLHQTRQSGGVANERASLYSATGIAPTFTSDRNSFYAGKQSILGDGGSIKSGLLSHGRTDSISGSIAGIGATGSPLASPREVSGAAVGKISRSNSAWGETNEEPAESSVDRTKVKE